MAASSNGQLLEHNKLSIYVTSHEFLGPNEVHGRNYDIDIF